MREIKIPSIGYVEVLDKYPIFPKIKVKELKKDNLSLITYVIAESDILVPIVISMPAKDYELEITDLIALATDTKEFAIKIKKSNFERWNHFEGKVDFTYEDGTTVHIRKVTH